jgi:hypothetical protein
LNILNHDLFRYDALSFNKLNRGKYDEERGKNKEGEF